METKRGNGASTALRCEPAWARTRPQEAHERPDLDANGDPPRARISAGRWPSLGRASLPQPPGFRRPSAIHRGGVGRPAQRAYVCGIAVEVHAKVEGSLIRPE